MIMNNHPKKSELQLPSSAKIIDHPTIHSNYINHHPTRNYPLPTRMPVKIILRKKLLSLPIVEISNSFFVKSVRSL